MSPKVEVQLKASHTGKSSCFLPVILVAHQHNAVLNLLLSTNIIEFCAAALESLGH